MRSISRYTGRVFAFPEHDIDPALKNAEWHLEYAEAVYSQYIRDRSGILYSKRDEMYLYRKYSEANQPVEKYMEIICPSDERTHERKGLQNISWDIVSILPKFRSIITGLFNKVEHDISANAINEAADNERMAKKYNLWSEKQLAGFFNQFPQELGLQAKTEELPTMPASLQELDMLKDIGTFKLKDEMAMEVAVKDSFYRSNWPAEIKDQIYEDFFDLGIAVTKDYVEPMTRAVKARYIDPIDFIVRYSRSKTFNKISHAAVLEYMTVATLRTAVKNARVSNIKEEDLRAIARQYSGYEGNPYLDQYDYYSEDIQSRTHPYDDTTITVMDLEFFSSDQIKYEKRKNKYGNWVLHRQSHNYKGKKTDTRIPGLTEKKVVYTCKWVVGTPFMYDWGLQTDVPREDPKEPKLSFHIYKISNKSACSQVVSQVDDIQLAILRIRNAAAVAAPKGLQIEFGSLNNMAMGGKKMDPLDILTIRRRSGDVIYKATTHHSQVNLPGGGKPVAELEGGMGATLTEQIAIIEFNLNMIRGTLGISELVDGSTPDPKTLVGVVESAQGAMNNVLQNLYKGYKFLKEETAKSMVLRHQILAHYGERNVHQRSLGGNIIQTLKIGASLTAMQFGITLEMRPSDRTKESIRAHALQSNAASKEGRPGISTADFLFIERALEIGNIKMAQMILAYKEKKATEKFELIAKQNQVFNRETVVVGEREKRETMATKIKAEGLRDIEVETAKSNLRIRERTIAHKQAMELNQAKTNSELGKTIIQTEASKENTDTKAASEETKSIIKATEPKPVPAPSPA